MDIRQFGNLQLCINENTKELNSICVKLDDLTYDSLGWIKFTWKCMIKKESEKLFTKANRLLQENEKMLTQMRHFIE